MLTRLCCAGLKTVLEPIPNLESADMPRFISSERNGNLNGGDVAASAGDARDMSHQAAVPPVDNSNPNAIYFATATDALIMRDYNSRNIPTATAIIPLNRDTPILFPQAACEIGRRTSRDNATASTVEEHELR